MILHALGYGYAVGQLLFLAAMCAITLSLPKYRQWLWIHIWLVSMGTVGLAAIPVSGLIQGFFDVYSWRFLLLVISTLMLDSGIVIVLWKTVRRDSM